MFSYFCQKIDVVLIFGTLLLRLWCCCLGLHNIVLSTPSTVCTVQNKKKQVGYTIEYTVSGPVKPTTSNTTTHLNKTAKAGSLTVLGAWTFRGLS